MNELNVLTKNEEIDTDVVKAIKKSAVKYRQFYPILLDINEEIIDGEHRRVAFPNPDTKKLPFIKTKRDRLEARLITNHARKGQSKKTWEFTLNELATILENDGIDGIGMKIASETGLPYRTIMRYLPSKFKDQRMQEVRKARCNVATEEGKSVKAPSLVLSPAKTIAEKRIPETKRTMPTMKILEEYKQSMGSKELPKIRIQRFSNQPWKAIIVPNDFFEKLEKACFKRDMDLEETLTLALVKLLDDLKGKNQ